MQSEGNSFGLVDAHYDGVLDRLIQLL